MSIGLVSISMITYNQEKHIAQAIESILMQETTFPIELVIGDDASTDTTPEICRSYQRKYPSCIKLNIAQKNQGSVINFLNTIYSCSGNFIAICDGDDFWTDKHKLQEQVLFLASHTDFSFCFTNINWVDEANNELKASTQYYNTDVFNHQSYVGLVTPPTLSTVFRKSALPQHFPEVFKSLPNTDMFLKALLSTKGKVKFINKITGSYRINSKGVYSGMNAIKKTQDKIKAYLIMLNYFTDKNVKHNLKRGIGNGYLKLLFIMLGNFEILLFSKTMLQFIKFCFQQKYFPFHNFIADRIQRKKNKSLLLSQKSA
jgi:glycosyltransferase involved in cell wall biosynthesis